MIWRLANWLAADPVRRTWWWLGSNVLLCCFCVGLGATVAHWYYQGKIAALQAAHAKEQRDEAQAVAHAAQVLREKNDALEARLLAIQGDIQSRSQEQSHALKTHLVNRPCLSADAVRVLNSAAAALPGGETKTEPGANAASGIRFATDADVGGWAVDARARYRTCAARLNALIDFEETGHEF